LLRRTDDLRLGGLASAHNGFTDPPLLVGPDDGDSDGDSAAPLDSIEYTFSAAVRSCP